MSVLIIGSMALDAVRTPFGEKKNILGGSAVHSAVAASFFSAVKLVSVVGKDFPKAHLDFLKSLKMDVNGVKVSEGDTFRWSGYYEYDMNQAHTLETALNVLASFDPELSAEDERAEFVFLANLDPEVQQKILARLRKPRVVCLDTMDFWIKTKRGILHEVIKKVDYLLMNEGEARQFMETPSLVIAGRRLRELGAKNVIIKKGEHGALLFTRDNHFSAPSYPQEALRDPTGAGDSFAGGFIGYLAKTGDFSEEGVRQAVILGSVMASFNIEDFGLDRMKRLKPKEIVERYEEVRRYSRFEALSLAHWI